MKELVKYLVVLLIAFGGGPAGAALWQWSQAPASNSAADPSINWTAGMPSTAVEPSGRAMMARLAEYRDDISGLSISTGTSTAYVLATNAQGGGHGICTGTAPIDGQLVSFTPNVTNGAAAVLTVDGCSAFAITALGTAAPAATMIAGTPYTLKFSLSATAWTLRNFYVDPYGVPLGGLLAYTVTGVPNSNFILPAGQCISTVTYANYWALLGSPGIGTCAANQFRVIDLRGEALAALDNLNGTPANRLTSAATGCGTAMTSVGATCANGGESQTLTTAQLAAGITAANGAQPITVTGPVGHTIYGNGGGTSAGTSALLVPAGGSFFTTLSFAGNNSIALSSNNTSGQAHPNVLPSIAVSYLLRVI